MAHFAVSLVVFSCFLAYVMNIFIQMDMMEYICVDKHAAKLPSIICMRRNTPAARRMTIVGAKRVSRSRPGNSTFDLQMTPAPSRSAAPAL